MPRDNQKKKDEEELSDGSDHGAGGHLPAVLPVRVILSPLLPSHVKQRFLKKKWPLGGAFI